MPRIDYCAVDDALFEVSPDLHCFSCINLLLCYGDHAAGSYTNLKKKTFTTVN